MATQTAEAPARRRGRPRKGEATATKKGNPNAFIEPVREGLRNIIGVCETCGHTTRPIQPVAEEIGVSPVVLAKFIRGEAGVSLDTFGAMHAFVEEHKNDEKADENAPATEGAPA